MTFKYPISTATAVGLRDYQEDRYFTATMEEGTLVGVFDGHGGGEASAACEDQFPECFVDAIGEPGTDPAAAIRKAFADMAARTAEFASGTTATIAYFPWNKSGSTWTVDTVWVAVLGDSPAIVKDAEGAVGVGPEHNVRSNYLERDAAIQRGGTYDGGYLFDYTGPHGMYGQGLQMARALGDRELARVLSREPEIYSRSLGPGSYVLVATDGVLDPSHHKPAETAAAVVSLIEGGADAQRIVDAAVLAKTGDNATAILARFE